MTAAKKKNLLPVTRYSRNAQLVDVLEGAAVLLHDGEMPAGVTKGGGGELLFQGVPITDSSFLLYDELGNPLELWSYDDFKATYASAFDAPGGASLQEQLADANKLIGEMKTTALDQNGTIDGLRGDRDHLKNLIERVAAGLGLKIDEYESEEAFVAAVTAAKAGDTATNVLRDILRIEAAQTRDDGGRIIHLNKKIIDRIVAVV
jgi:hypothetical protein